MELVAVVLHCKTSVDRFESAKALLNYGFSGYALVTPQPEAVPARTFPELWAEFLKSICLSA